MTTASGNEAGDGADVVKTAAPAPAEETDVLITMKDATEKPDGKDNAKKSKGKPGDDATEDKKMVPFGKMFTYADCTDWVLIVSLR